MQTTRKIRRLQRRRPRNREERGSERLRGTILQECCGHCSRGSATFSLCLPLHVATALLRLVRHCPTLFLPLALSPGSLARFTQPLLPRRRSFVGIEVECALQSAPLRPDAPPPPTRTSLSGCAFTVFIVAAGSYQIAAQIQYTKEAQASFFQASFRSPTELDQASARANDRAGASVSGKRQRAIEFEAQIEVAIPRGALKC